MLDLAAVRRFTENLNEQLRRCDHGEGTMCSTLEESINHYVAQCAALRQYINQWARAIYTGEAAFEPEVEGLLKDELRHVLNRAKQVAARGRAMDGYCYVLQGLNDLHGYIVDLDYLLENWVRPRRAVRPAPRVKLSTTVEQKISSRLRELST
jgi:hypothetical protein